MEPHIYNADLRYDRANLLEPTSLGYLYMAGVVDSGWSPIIMPSSKRSQLLKELKDLSSDLKRDERVVSATVFRPIVKPVEVEFLDLYHCES
jgi:hypothetical protein